MFTGIITDMGELVRREGGRFAIRCSYKADGIAIGASIACDGACLTATAVEPAAGGAIFHVDVSDETLSRTTLGDWQPGRRAVPPVWDARRWNHPRQHRRCHTRRGRGFGAEHDPDASGSDCVRGNADAAWYRRYDSYNRYGGRLERAYL